MEPWKRGVAEAEDAAVGGDEPVALAVGGGGHADDGPAICRARTAAAGGRAEAGDRPRGRLRGGRVPAQLAAVARTAGAGDESSWADATGRATPPSSRSGRAAAAASGTGQATGAAPAPFGGAGLGRRAGGAPATSDCGRR